MFLDKELDVICLLQTELKHSEPLLYKSNSFCKKVSRYIKSINSFSDNSGHEALPPDYYSDELNCMFDVMRVNDTEIRKTYNPVKIRERKIEQELKDKGILQPHMTLIVNSESDDVQEHTYKNYKRNCKRVLNEHIAKIDIWQKEHPRIQNKGLLICDETECYFDGHVIYTGNETFAYFGEKNVIELHRPWMDSELVEKAYDSKLDFIIWFSPYKPHSILLEKYGLLYPSIVVLDTRYKRTDFINYDEEKLLKYQWFDHRVNFDKSMLQTLYDESHGIIDQMVGIFSAMQYEYFYQDKNVTIDSAYIKKIAASYYPGLSRLNKNLASADAEQKRKAIIDKAASRQSEIAEIASKKEFEKEIRNAHPDAIPLETIIKNVNVLAGFLINSKTFTEDDIVMAYNNIMKIKGDHTDEKTLTNDVYTLLTEMNSEDAIAKIMKQKSTVPVSRKTAKESMQKALDEHTYVPK